MIHATQIPNVKFKGDIDSLSKVTEEVARETVKGLNRRASKRAGTVTVTDAPKEERITLDEADMKAIRELGRARPEAYIALGQGLAAEFSEDHKGAAVRFGKAVENDPRNAWCYMLRARAHSRSRQRLKALSDYEKVASLMPQDYLGWIGRGHAYCCLMDYEAAIADYAKAVKLRPEASRKKQTHRYWRILPWRWKDRVRAGRA
jgi:tetratricopeptide (TPR) repeat protein